MVARLHTTSRIAKYARISKHVKMMPLVSEEEYWMIGKAEDAVILEHFPQTYSERTSKSASSQQMLTGPR
jgi:hypothetical protein